MRRVLSRPGRTLAVLGMVVAVALPNTGATSAATPDDWPSFGHDPGHSGVSGETTISTANAPSLGVKWQVNTGDAVTASPVVTSTRSSASGWCTSATTPA